MKKESIHILVTITLVFAALVAGVQLGRNMDNDEVTIQMSVGSATHSTGALETGADNDDAQFTTQPIKGRKLNINTASVEELDALPGIGPAIAQSIIDCRQENGPFRDVSELLNVSGIGEKKMSEIIELITVED